MNRREFLRRTVGAIAAVGGGAAGAMASDGSGGLERERMCVPRVLRTFSPEELAYLRQPTVFRVTPPCEVYYIPPHRDCHCGGEGTG